MAAQQILEKDFTGGDWDSFKNKTSVTHWSLPTYLQALGHAFTCSGLKAKCPDAHCTQAAPPILICLLDAVEHGGPGPNLPTVLGFPRLAMPADLGDPVCPLLKPTGMALRISLQPLLWMSREAACGRCVMLRFYRLVLGLLAPVTYTSPGFAFPVPFTPTWPHHSLPSAPVGALSKKKSFPAIECHVLMSSKLAATLCCCICCP